MTKTKPAKTFKETKAECKELGFQLTRNDYDEYELVPFSELGGEDEEAVTHYNNDLSDVLLTAQNWNRKS